jgi:CheY-like chemotaxis protein
MPDTHIRILIVDDEPSIRISMSRLLTELGYHARSAAEGFSALREIREEMPDILLTDLNMPGMSGVELLSVVWRRFPAIQKIAMSGAYSGNAVPSGVAADAFFQKGSSTKDLLQIIETLPQRGHRAAQPSSPHAPLRILRDGHESFPAACVTIVCPECLRTFPKSIEGMNGFAREANCIHCGNSIQYAIVESPGRRKAWAAKTAQNAPALSN